MKRIICTFLTVTFATILLNHSQVFAQNQNLPRMMTIGTMPVGTTVNMAGVGIAVVLNDHTPINVKVMPVANESVWIPMLRTKEIQMGVGLMPEVEKAYLGKGLWAKYTKKMKISGFPARLIALGAKAYLGFNVKGDSPIQSIKDLKGKKVARFAEGIALQDMVVASLASAGLTEKDVNFIPISNPIESGKALMDGRVDASWVAPDAPMIMEMVSKVNARYLPYDMSDTSQALMKKINTQFRVEIPEAAIPHVMDGKQPKLVFDWALFVSPEVSDDAVYEVIKAMYENHDEMKKKPALERWHKDRFCSADVFIPYHDGAIRYYTEKGLWNDAMDKVQSKLLDMQK